MQFPCPTYIDRNECHVHTVLKVEHSRRRILKTDAYKNCFGLRDVFLLNDLVDHLC